MRAALLIFFWSWMAVGAAIFLYMVAHTGYLFLFGCSC